jgi:tRNA (cmo5U34)-methyltransferase
MNAGDSIEVINSRWTFSGNTASNFDPHVTRSVPLYEEGHRLILKLSDFFLSDGSVCYEMGCSTATLIKKLAERQQHKTCEFIGVDIEPDMVRIAKEKCRDIANIQIIAGNVVEMDLKKSDLIVCYYTIQFIPTKVRQILIDKIFNALNWGGAFICFEKVRASDARFQDMMTSLYNDFKIENGYTPGEIFSKASSLKGILEPFSTQGNLDLMYRAGFKDVLTVMKYACFEGFLAIK